MSPGERPPCAPVQGRPRVPAGPSPRHRVPESRREQAHVPAQQPSPRQDARLPVADADARRSRDPVRPPPQGSRRAVGLSALPSTTTLPRTATPPPMLPPAARVRSPAEHRRVARQGRRSAAGPLSVSLLLPPLARGSSPAIGEPAVPSVGGARAGVVVPKAVGSAAVRNRVRRQLRHLLAPRLPGLPAGAVLVIRVSAPIRPPVPTGSPVPTRSPVPTGLPVPTTSAALATSLDRALARLLAVPPATSPTSPT